MWPHRGNSWEAARGVCKASALRTGRPGFKAFLNHSLAVQPCGETWNFSIWELMIKIVELSEDWMSSCRCLAQSRCFVNIRPLPPPPFFSYSLQSTELPLLPTQFWTKHTLFIMTAPRKSAFVIMYSIVFYSVPASRLAQFPSTFPELHSK